MRASRSAQRGLTLVELLVALTLGLIVIGALVGVFIANSNSYRQNEAVAVMQDNARFAMDAMGRDLAMAGYWGGVRPPDAGVNVRVSASAQAAVSNTAADGDCGPAGQSAGSHWLFNVGTAIEFLNQPAAGVASALLRCLDASTLMPFSDIVVVRHVAGQLAFADDEPLSGPLEPNRFYVKTNRNIASLFRATGTDFETQRSSSTDCLDGTGVSAPCPPLDRPQQVYAYTPQIYYVRNWLRTRGDGLPILCRRFLNDSVAPPFMDEDCFAEGVENVQLEWGIGDAVGNVLHYTSTPSAAELSMAVIVRLHLVVRSTAPGTQASADRKVYSHADYPAAANAAAPIALRRLFTTTVQLKNFQT